MIAHQYHSHGSRFVVWILLLCSLPIRIQGWGEDGHEIVGNLAYHLLSNKTRAAVDQILVNHPCWRVAAAADDNKNNTPLGRVANWADQIRGKSEFHWSSPLHYIDIRDDLVDGGCSVFDANNTQQQEQCRFIYDRDCHDDFCVAGSIVNYTQSLSSGWRRLQQQQETSQSVPPTITGQRFLRGIRASSSLFMASTSNYYPGWSHIDHSSRTTQAALAASSFQPPNYQQQQPTLVQESLMFVTHFIGDIHQPLHCARATDRGGNTIHVTFDPTFTTTTTTSRRQQQQQQQQQYNSDPFLNKFHHHHHSLELHAVWDTTMIEHAIETTYHHSRSAMEDELLRYIQRAKEIGHVDKWLACPDTSHYNHCTSLWAQESFLHAMEWAYKNVDNATEVTSGTRLTKIYYETRIPHIQQYLAVAGVRLAAALELALSGHGENSGGGGSGSGGQQSAST